MEQGTEPGKLGLKPEDDDGPPDIGDEVKLTGELANATADDILDIADVDLRACSTPADVKEAEETFSQTVARLPIKADREMFAEMVSEALQRVAK